MFPEGNPFISNWRSGPIVVDLLDVDEAQRLPLWEHIHRHARKAVRGKKACEIAAALKCTLSQNGYGDERTMRGLNTYALSPSPLTAIPG